jgi:ATP-dependent RNA helicase RhlE
LRAIEEFDSGKYNILIATEIIARGLDFGEVTHVINIDTPSFPENYIHRIGRTGRAKSEGVSILLFTEKEEVNKKAIEELMAIELPVLSIPEEVELSNRKTAAERPDPMAGMSLNRKTIHRSSGPGVHEKSEKNSKENLGGSYRRKLEAKYKKRQTRGDKIANRKKKGK